MRLPNSSTASSLCSTSSDSAKTGGTLLGAAGFSWQDYPMSYILRTIVTAASFWVALWLLPGMQLTSDTGAPDTGESIIALLIISVVFGLINGVVRPIVSFLSLPITCLTLGLFTLVINAAMLSLTVWATSFLPVYVTIDNFFWTTILAALIIAVVSTLVNRLISTVTPTH